MKLLFLLILIVTFVWHSQARNFLPRNLSTHSQDFSGSPSNFNNFYQANIHWWNQFWSNVQTPSVFNTEERFIPFSVRSSQSSLESSEPTAADAGDGNWNVTIVSVATVRQGDRQKNLTETINIEYGPDGAIRYARQRVMRPDGSQDEDFLVMEADETENEGTSAPEASTEEQWSSSGLFTSTQAPVDLLPRAPTTTRPPVEEHAPVEEQLGSGWTSMTTQAPGQQQVPFEVHEAYLRRIENDRQQAESQGLSSSSYGSSSLSSSLASLSSNGTTLYSNRVENSIHGGTDDRGLTVTIQRNATGSTPGPGSTISQHINSPAGGSSAQSSASVSSNVPPQDA